MDEACLILNVKKDTPLEAVTKVSYMVSSPGDPCCIFPPC